MRLLIRSFEQWYYYCKKKNKYSREYAIIFKQILYYQTPTVQNANFVTKHQWKQTIAKEWDTIVPSRHLQSVHLEPMRTNLLPMYFST